MILVQIAICAYITLVANYTMERDLRDAPIYSPCGIAYATRRLMQHRDAMPSPVWRTVMIWI